MNRRAFQSLCWWVLVVMIGGCLTLSLVLKRDYTIDDLFIIPSIGYVLVGAIVARRRPENPIGWIFLVIPLFGSFSTLAGTGVDAALDAGQPVAWWGVLAAWGYSWLWLPEVTLALTFTFLLFPEGLPSPRWRPVLWLTAAATVAATVTMSLAPTLDVGDPKLNSGAFTIRNPTSPFAPSLGHADWPLWLVALLAICLVCGFMAMGSVAWRTWRSSGVERLQLRLFVCAVLLLGLQVLASLLIPGFDGSLFGSVTFLVGFTFIVIACGIAILRYRLYDIDRIIGRTTTYALATGVLLSVYVAVVTAVSQLLPDSSDLAVAAATLAAAAVFRPVWGWVQRLVDRRFNREQYDAQRSVEQFAGRLRNEVNSDEVSDDLLAMLDRTVQPTASGLWLREPSS